MDSRQYTFNNSTITIKFGNIIESHSEVIASSDDCYITMKKRYLLLIVVQ